MVKKILTRSVVVLLLLSMLLAMAACGGGGKTTTDKGTGPVEPSGTDLPSQLVGMNDEYDDTTVEIIYVEGGNGTYTADSLIVDPNSGDLDDVDMGVIERNNLIEENLGVTLDAFTDETLNFGDLYTFAKIYFDTQDPALDVYAGYQYFDISVATTAHLYNLNELKNSNGETLIDISKDYWATDYINSITYNNNMFWVTGDLALRYTGGLYCTFVNLELYDLYVKGNYEGKSIYQLVDEKQWHMQTMLDMANMAYDDSDNSGTATELDRLGIVYELCDVMDGYAFGCDVAFSKKITSGGKDTITIEIQNDSKAESLASFLKTMTSANYAYDAGSADSQNMMPIFAAGQTLFCLNKINMAEIYLSDMDNFGIVPPPMLNQAQGKYMTGVHDSVTIFGVSKYSDCPELAAATLELMAYYGKTLVSDVYYNNVILGSRTIQDDDSARMIVKIREGFDSDFAAAWSNSLSNIVHIYRTPSNLKQFPTYIKISSRDWPNKLTELLTQIEQAVLEQ